jgi:hypothetical protein
VALGPLLERREDEQICWTRGSKSRNKVSVGEPADGSLLFHNVVHPYFGATREGERDEACRSPEHTSTADTRGHLPVGYLPSLGLKSGMLTHPPPPTFRSPHGCDDFISPLENERMAATPFSCEVRPLLRRTLLANHRKLLLYAVDHSARVSMKSAASCVN